MLYYVEYPPENAIKYKNIPEFQNYKICFNTNGYEPIQVMKQRKLGNPLTYRKYLEKEETSFKRK